MKDMSWCGHQAHDKQMRVDREEENAQEAIQLEILYMMVAGGIEEKIVR